VNVNVRSAEERDIPAIVDLWWEMMHFHAAVDSHFQLREEVAAREAWKKHLREDIWEQEEWIVLVAEADGELVGQIIGTVRDPHPVYGQEPYGFVSDLVVAPEARRSGVAQALFEALKAWFREKDVSHLELQVAHNNPTSQGFWRAMGCQDYMDTMWYDLEIT